MHTCRLLHLLVCAVIVAYPLVPWADDAPDRSGLPSFAAARIDGVPPVDSRVTPLIGRVVVHGKFGGRIFGFDIDQNGSEGVLSEAVRLDNGDLLAAVETFDLRTGEIIAVLATTQSQDDFLTLGVVGNGVGLIEFEHEIDLLNVERTFHVINPLSSNRFTREWTPPIDADHLIERVSRTQGSPQAAFYAYDNSENFQPFVFRSDVAANTFGPAVPLTDENFSSTGLVPVLAYNHLTHKAVLGIATLGNPFVPPVFALVDLNDGTQTVFSGVGLGDVNGIAVDAETNIACTTTEIDFSVQFYDLASQAGFSQFLPGAISQFQSGADVAVDPLHRLFLVAQPNSSTAPGTSSIHVYDEQGNYIKSIDGFHFSDAGNVVRMHIALYPSRRFGYVDGPDPGVTEIQGFRY